MVMFIYYETEVGYSSRQVIQCLVIGYLTVIGNVFLNIGISIGLAGPV